MGARLKRTAGVLGIGTVAVAVAVGVASRRWQVATERLIEQLRGRASMLGAVLGIVRVVEAADDPPLRAGALQRYLAEAVWFPTALLPREGLRWSPVDDAHARATLTDGGTAATLEFEFGPSGEIVGCYTPGRQRSAPDEPGRYHTLPWGGRYRRYEERAGVRVPRESEVYWVVNGMEQPYYRGRNLQVAFNFGE